MGHYRLHQTLQSVDGELYFFDIWPNVELRNSPYHHGKHLSWLDFLKEQRCKNHLSLHDISGYEYDELLKEYNSLCRLF